MLGKFLSFILIIILRFYKLFISPMLGNRCRFEPTCSVYAMESLKTHGLIKGIHLSFKRIIKCHPFGKYGYDPVPVEKKNV